MSTSKVLYRNDQWAVTRYGVESLENEYAIEKARLGQRAHHLGPEVSDWIVHVCAKSWVHGHLFVDAFRHAVELHAVKNPPDVDLSERLARAERDFARSLPPIFH